LGSVTFGKVTHFLIQNIFIVRILLSNYLNVDKNTFILSFFMVASVFSYIGRNVFRKDFRTKSSQKYFKLIRFKLRMYDIV